MIRDILTDKWFIFGISFLLVFGIGCYLWFQREITPYRQEAAKSAEILRQWELSQNAEDTVNTKKRIDTVQNETPFEEQKYVLSETKTVPDIVPEKTSEITVNVSSGTDETKTFEGVPVSPFGFGPYPKVPDGMTFIPWERFPNANHELIRRVRIKLWEEGIRSDGAVMENGLVYPTVRGRVYLQEGSMLSHPEDNLRLIQGRLPDLSGFDVYSFEDGIEPYSYLNLER